MKNTNTIETCCQCSKSYKANDSTSEYPNLFCSDRCQKMRQKD